MISTYLISSILFSEKFYDYIKIPNWSRPQNAMTTIKNRSRPHCDQELLSNMNVWTLIRLTVTNLNELKASREPQTSMGHLKNASSSSLVSPSVFRGPLIKDISFEASRLPPTPWLKVQATKQCGLKWSNDTRFTLYMWAWHYQVVFPFHWLQIVEINLPFKFNLLLEWTLALSFYFCRSKSFISSGTKGQFAPGPRISDLYPGKEKISPSTHSLFLQT